MGQLVFCFLIISSIILGATGSNILFYIALMVGTVYYLYLYCRSKNNKYLVYLILLSIISPDNYLIIVINLLFFLLKINDVKIKRSISTYMFLLFFIYLFVNVLINDIKIINFLFSIIYTFQVFTGLLIANNEYRSMKDRIEVEVFTKKMLIVEILSVLSLILFNFNTFISRPDGDIIVGTFGQYQGNTFAIFLLFAILIMIKQQYYKNITYIVIALMLFIMTGSIMLIFIALLASLIYIIGFQKNFLKKSIKYIPIILFCSFFFIQITPEWVFRSINSILNERDITQSIGKVKGIEIVFDEIPSIEFKNYIIGEGIGQYSSRAAMTCTGEYIDSYTKLFPVSMSEYTSEFIFPQLVLTKQLHNSLSLKDTYYSSVISVMGELGIIGIVFFILYVLYLMKKSKGYSKIFVIFFVFACFIDNYLEFAKVISLLYLLINLYNEREIRYENK